MKWIIPTILILAVLMTACSSKEPAVVQTVEQTSTDKLLLPEDASTMVNCMNEKGMVMYGTEWCPHCQRQKAMFGEAIAELAYVDCDKNAELCTAAGVKGYPTWVLDGQLYEGEQTWKQIKDLTGCTEQPPIGNETQ